MTAVTGAQRAQGEGSLARGEGAGRAEAGPPSLSAGLDLGGLMASVMLDDRDMQTDAARGRADGARRDHDRALHDQQAAEEQARAAQDSAGFWAKHAGTLLTVAKVAGVVAAAASCVVSGGSAAPAAIALAGALLSASSGYVKEHCGEKAGAVALWGGAAISLGAGGYQVGAALLSSGATASATAGSTLSEKLATWVQLGARATEGSAHVGEGYAKIREGRYEGEALDAEATRTERKADATASQRDLDEVVDALHMLDASVRRAMATVMATEGDLQATRAAVVARVGRSV